MSEYATKNYTEQGGEVTHIGGSLVFDSGAIVEGFPYDKASDSDLGGVKVGTGLSISSGGDLSVKAASASELGGVKVGAGLEAAADGTLSAKAAAADTAGIVKMAANQAASTAADVEGLKADLNALISKLKTAGIMAPDSVS